MRWRRSKRSAVLPSFVLALLAVAACESSPAAPDAGGPDGVHPPLASRSGERGGKKGKGDSEPSEPPPAPQYDWYVLAVPDDFDPLYRFGLVEGEALLRTDPSVTSWGTDYWGYWDEPFPFDGEAVRYTIGLTRTTYELSPLADGRIDVTRTLIVGSYLGGESTTTVTHVGAFEPEG